MATTRRLAELDETGKLKAAQVPDDVTTSAELTAAVQAAVDALVAGAPGALDTLNELAAALGDDAAFATTVTTALAAKADTASLGTAAAEDVEAFDPAGSAATAETNANAYTDTEIGGLSGAFVGVTGDQTVAGVKTFSSDPIIPDEVYGSGWDGSLEPPTKNAVYDKIQALNFGIPMVGNPAEDGGTAAIVPVANWAMAHRFRVGGTFAKVGVAVTAQSGNICVAVHSNTGSGRNAAPGTQLITTGAIACPGTGYQEIALGGSVTVTVGDWLILSADNTTAAIGHLAGPSGNTSDLSKGFTYFRPSSHPVPSSFTAPTAYNRRVPVVVGVP